MNRVRTDAASRPGRLRRVMFKIHLWTGLASGLYVLAICISGSAIVFRREMNRTFCHADGGVFCEPPFVTWLSRFHGELLGGFTGLRWNGVGAIAVMAMCLSGAILWWPGRSGWRQRLLIQRGISGRRFLQNIHNVLGAWFFALILVWAITGIYFAFPELINGLTLWLEEEAHMMHLSLHIQDATASVVRLHFGRAYGMVVKILWAVFGLVPCVLFVTGTVMWWKRRFRRT